jgi:hypothetical protein
MKIDFTPDILSQLIEQAQFEFMAWCWTMVVIIAFAVVMIVREDVSRRRRNDVLFYVGRKGGRR